MAHRSKMPPIPSEMHSKVRNKKVKQKDKHLQAKQKLQALVKEKSLKLDMRLKYEIRPKAVLFK